MQKERMAKWLEALKSGEYKHTRYHLKNAGCHCAWGVAAELAIKDGCDISWTAGPFWTERQVNLSELRKWYSVDAFWYSDVCVLNDSSKSYDSVIKLLQEVVNK